jgi:hypothetical protein
MRTFRAALSAIKGGSGGLPDMTDLPVTCQLIESLPNGR